MKTLNGSRLTLLLFFLIGIMACKMDDNEAPSAAVPENSDNMEPDTASTKPLGNKPLGGPIRIRVGATTFTATLLDNPTVTAFKTRLPMTVSMSELNGNEKLYYFPTGLPTNSSNPRTINTGDLMLYGSTTLVLFYKSFPTSYSYTKLGQVDNPAGLEAALGSGSVTVSYDLQ